MKQTPSTNIDVADLRGKCFNCFTDCEERGSAAFKGFNDFSLEWNGLDIKNGDRHPKLMSNSASKLPKRTHSLREPSQSSSMPSPRQTRSRMGASRPMSSTNSRKPPSHLVSNVEKDNPRGTTGTALSQNTMAAAYTTLGNSTSKHGTNSEYLLIKPKHGTVNNRTSFHKYILKTITRNYFYTQRCFYNFLNHITQNYHAYNSAA